MADWFKFYENDIDEMRLQWAIGELSEVLSVWIALLSEACRHKDGTLSGYCQDFELFALAKRINVTVPKVNTSIELLVKIGYLKRMDDKSLLIRKWEEKQSEYCQKKTRLQNQSGGDHHTKRTKSPDTVPIVSRQCPSRGEERRVEEMREDSAPKGADYFLNHDKKRRPSSLSSWCNRFIHLWADRYKQRFGKPYLLGEPKEEAAAKGLEKHGMAPEELMDIAITGWSSKNEYIRGISPTISGFKMVFNQIQATPKKDPVTGRVV